MLPEREPNARASLLLRSAHGEHDVRRKGGVRRTSRSARAGDSVKIEHVQKRFSALERNMGNVGGTPLAVDPNSFAEPRQQFLFESGFKRRRMRTERLSPILRFLQRGGEPDDRRRVERTAPKSPFLLAPCDKRGKGNALFDDENTDALRSVNLVSRQRYGVAKSAERFQIARRRRLYAVGKEIYALLSAQFAHFFERLDAPRLVIDRHEAHQPRIFSDRSRNRIFRDDSVISCGSDAFVRTKRCGGLHGGMFDCRIAHTRLIGVSDISYRPIVRLRSADVKYTSEGFTPRISAILSRACVTAYAALRP